LWLCSCTYAIRDLIYFLVITPEEYFVMKSEAEIFEKAKQKAIDQWKAEKK
jgi:hypothetical protein